MSYSIRGLYIQIIVEYEDITNLKFLHWIKIPTNTLIHLYQLPRFIEIITKYKNKKKSVIILENLIAKLLSSDPMNG